MYPFVYITISSIFFCPFQNNKPLAILVILKIRPPPSKCPPPPQTSCLSLSLSLSQHTHKHTGYFKRKWIHVVFFFFRKFFFFTKVLKDLNEAADRALLCGFRMKINVVNRLSEMGWSQFLCVFFFHLLERTVCVRARDVCFKKQL